MTYLKNLLARVRKDEKGATMVEYSILIGLITAAVIAAIVFVGGWVGTQWSDLQTALQGGGGGG